MSLSISQKSLWTNWWEHNKDKQSIKHINKQRLSNQPQVNRPVQHTSKERQQTNAAMKQTYAAINKQIQQTSRQEQQTKAHVY